MALRAYSVGGPVRPDVRRLHLNEYRQVHAPGVVEAMREAVGGASVEELLTHYQVGPDPTLAADLARYVGAPSERNVFVAAGSDEVLRAVIDTSGSRGHRSVLMGVPGYAHFEHYARLRGLEVVAYPIGLATSAPDHEAALRYYAGLLEAGCLVYLGSPNNPTGDLWPPATVAALAAEYPRALFLVDEAYVEFASVADDCARDDDRPCDDDAAALNAKSLARVALAHANVVVARTLSKAFGLAALRVGYAVGTALTIGELGVAVSPKAFNPIAARVARAALRNAGHYRAAAAAAVRGMRDVARELRRRGWWVRETPGNFYLVYAADAAGVTARLAEAGVQVRDRDALPGLAGFVRLTAGSPEDNDAVLDAFARLAPPAAPPPQAAYANKGTVAAAKTLTRTTLAILGAAGVEVWAQGGTMLGMFRHRSELIPGGMVPWDDDVDLAYLAREGADPLAGLVADFARAGLALQRNRTDAYWQVGTNAPGALISAVHVDVFSYRATGSGAETIYALDDPRFREEEPDSAEAHCNTKYAHDELYPLSREYRFYDLVIPMPARAEAALRRALGPDFATVARVRAGADRPAVFPIRDLTPA